MPIDTSGLAFIVAGAPEPVLDFETKQQRVDDSGAPLSSIALMVLGEGQPEIISVKLAGAVPSLAVGQSAKLHGLVATPWSMGDRSGVSFKSSKVEAGAAPAPQRQAG
jgi:hypothetical protein